MNSTGETAKSATIDFKRLDGKTVLVKSRQDRRNPPTAVRGWIEVRENPGAAPDVSLALEFPQMFRHRAHRQTIPLDATAVQRLLDSEYNGTFEFTVDDDWET